ncbi:hypothetical protein HOT57_gp64 [Pseudomonas phage phCDa]|uniref:Uncharacterized protein n=1 Tax=Pseudomonas phage phCDa TaxID=2268587 RepID=A0A2Z5HA65_9CAUD|nr:hypothetical protein HOT57_gp64 [Pseudomonas phage phCDa]AXC36508.1 hypothetical protein phCDa_64 [Pseudomonas phage phCDa]
MGIGNFYEGGVAFFDQAVGDGLSTLSFTCWISREVERVVSENPHVMHDGTQLLGTNFQMADIVGFKHKFSI